MYDKETNRLRRKEFWTGFGQQMGRHTSARGRKQKWLNYRTGIKDLYFRLELVEGTARVAIDLQHKNEGIRELFFQQFEELKLLLESSTGQEWVWLPAYRQETGKMAARIFIEAQVGSIDVKEDWPRIWAWFEPILLGLDEVWGDAYDIFRDLQE